MRRRKREREGGNSLRAREIKRFVGPCCRGAGVGVACVSVLSVSAYVLERRIEEAYGAMMIRAPGCGMPPMLSMVSGTWSSHWSSCLLRVGPSSEYQDPA